MPLIPNHLICLDALDEALQQAAAQSRPMGLCLLWLDCVYRIDAIFGYRAGDTVCAKSLAHLKNILKDEDQVFRVGRSEIACLLPTLSNETQAVLAAHKIIRTLGSQLALDQYAMHSEPYVGVALFPAHGQSADALLQRASSALREARNRKEPVFVYSNEADTATQFQLQLQTDLRHALDENVLTLNHQPQTDLRSGRVVGFEALSRWHSPSRGAVSPTVFIQAAEVAGLMHRLTGWALNVALREFQELQSTARDLTISINLSAHDLIQAELPALLSQALGTWSVPAACVVIEITETAIMDDQRARATTLERLKEIGVQLAIDDFGTGYSSLARLKHLPVDELKIDVSFIRHMLRDTRDENIVRSIIDLAHHLGLRVVAEGVEDEATLQRLVEMDCDVAQGYFLSPPLPLAEFRFWLTQSGRSDR
ncbi:MAG: GGDEF domain-containing phosphodiesterase [Burkholderiales bacterium]|nr:GGDEF domain-containing phosphodiesterase [Burkholderiales bacterium]